MASSGEAVLVLPSAVAHPASAPVVVAAAPQRLAGGIAVPMAAMAALPNMPLAPLVTPAGDDDDANTVATTDAGGLGELAALTVPISAVTQVSETATASTLLPQVINFGDAPPPPLVDAADDISLPTGLDVRPLPLRLLDLAALPELATATPAMPDPLLPRRAIAIDWLSGFDAGRLIDDAGERNHQRIRSALAAQADTAVADDKDALRLAIARLEALIDRIGALSA